MFTLILIKKSGVLTTKRTIYALLFTLFPPKANNIPKLFVNLQRYYNVGRNMSIDTYKLTSMEEPSDEVLEQLMREVAEEASQTNREATTRFFEEIKQAAAAY